MSKIVLMSAVFFLFSLATFAQQEKEELKKMHAIYAVAKTFSMDISMQLSGNSSDMKTNQVEEGKVYKDNDNYYSEMLGRITLVNDHCCLLIDKTQKLLVYSVPEKSTGKDKSMDAVSAIPDSTVFKGAKLRFISQTTEEHVIELKYDKDVMYDKIEISIDPKTHYLTRVVYYYANVDGKSPVYTKSEITYKNIHIDEPVSASLFSEKKYVTVTKDKVVPLANYVSYEVIDQRRYNNYATKPH